MLIYSPTVASFIQETESNNLVAQNDYAFMKNVFSVLARLFDLTPSFKIEEFFAPNTAVERKVSFMLMLIQTIKNKEQQLTGGMISKSRQSATPQSKPMNPGGGKTKSVTFR